MENRMRPAERDQMLHKGQKILIPFVKIPVQPGGLIVLTVSIIVTILGIAKFISRQKYRRSLAQKEHKHGIAQLSCPQLQNLLLADRTFHATVPGIIVVTSVPVIFPVGLIVLLVIGNHVHHGKAIGACHEV